MDESRSAGRLAGLIGWAAVFLASADARWITGQLLCVDGGMTLVGPSRGVGAEPRG